MARATKQLECFGRIVLLVAAAFPPMAGAVVGVDGFYAPSNQPGKLFFVRTQRGVFNVLAFSSSTLTGRPEFQIAEAPMREDASFDIPLGRVGYLPVEGLLAPLCAYGRTTGEVCGDNDSALLPSRSVGQLKASFPEASNLYFSAYQEGEMGYQDLAVAEKLVIGYPTSAVGSASFDRLADLRGEWVFEPQLAGHPPFHVVFDSFEDKVPTEVGGLHELGLQYRDSHSNTVLACNWWGCQLSQNGKAVLSAHVTEWGAQQVQAFEGAMPDLRGDVWRGSDKVLGRRIRSSSGEWDGAMLLGQTGYYRSTSGELIAVAYEVQNGTGLAVVMVPMPDSDIWTYFIASGAVAYSDARQSPFGGRVDFMANLYSFSGGPCLVCAAPNYDPGSHASIAGTVHLTFSSLSDATMAIAWGGNSPESYDLKKSDVVGREIQIGRGQVVPSLSGHWLFFDSENLESTLHAVKFDIEGVPDASNNRVVFSEFATRNSLSCESTSCGLYVDSKLVAVFPLANISSAVMYGCLVSNAGCGVKAADRIVGMKMDVSSFFRDSVGGKRLSIPEAAPTR